MNSEKVKYKVIITSTFYIPGFPKKREPVAVVKSEREANMIAFRLNGRSRPEPLYKVEKVVA